jgi:hypothetical protein
MNSRILGLEHEIKQLRLCIYTVKCVVCGKEISLRVYEDEKIEERLEMLDAEMREYHENRGEER